MTGGGIRKLDILSLLGIPLALGVVLAAQVLEGGSARALWQPTALLVVLGGTCGAVLVSFPVSTVWEALVAAATAFGRETNEIDRTVQRMIAYSLVSRRKGVIALESELDRTPEVFLYNALMLAIDGTDHKTVRQILETESAAIRAREEVPADVLETAAGYTPTLGILGAVLGLIHVMQSIGEPAKLASGIAVAFVATVYGVGAANLLLLPLASRLRTRAQSASRYREVIIQGIVGLQEGLNPRLIEQKLRGYVTSPPRGMTTGLRQTGVGQAVNS